MIANRSATSKATLPTSPIDPGCPSIAAILQATRGEIGRLIDHSGLDVLPVRGRIARPGTDRIVRDAQLDCLGCVEGADRYWGLVDDAHELAGRLPEESDRGHMVGDLGRHRLGWLREIYP